MRDESWSWGHLLHPLVHLKALGLSRLGLGPLCRRPARLLQLSGSVGLVLPSGAKLADHIDRSSLDDRHEGASLGNLSQGPGIGERRQARLRPGVDVGRHGPARQLRLRLAGTILDLGKPARRRLTCAWAAFSA